jgi:hypothetical protein
MEETGCDLFIDVHGDEELTYNFIAGNEGIPSWDDRLKSLQVRWIERLMEADFQACFPDFMAQVSGCETFSPSRKLFCKERLLH